MAARKMIASLSAGRTWEVAKKFIPKDSESVKKLAAVGTANVARNNKAYWKDLIVKQPAKFFGSVLAWHTIDDFVNDWLDDLENGESNPVVSKVISEAREQIRKLQEMQTPIIEEGDYSLDNKVNGEELHYHSIDAFLTAQEVFKTASAALGGESRLLALQTWLNLDDDLKNAVLNRSLTGNFR